MPTVERTPYERESLIFPTPQEGREFSERVGEKLQQNDVAGIGRHKEIVAEEIAAQLEKTGEGVQSIKHPWEHTPAEHAEAQHLVDIAFSKDLWAAVGQARKSEHYPRNLDLFHDVLTNEMYQLIKEHNLQRQSLIPAGLGLALILSVGLLAIALIFLVSVR